MQPVATNTAIAAKNRLSCISGGMVVFPSPEHHSDKGYRYQSFRNSPGILAMFAAIRRASSRLSNLTAGNFQQHEIAIQKLIGDSKRDQPNYHRPAIGWRGTIGVKIGQVFKPRSYFSSSHDLSAAWAKRRFWRALIGAFVGHGKSFLKPQMSPDTRAEMYSVASIKACEFRTTIVLVCH